MRFDNPLRAGEERAFEITVRCLSISGKPQPYLQHCPRGVRTNELILQVIFDSQAAPKEVVYSQRDSHGTTVDGPEPIKVSPTGLAEKRIENLVNFDNTYGIRWE